jgi:hypothetical protein
MASEAGVRNKAGQRTELMKREAEVNTGLRMMARALTFEKSILLCHASLVSRTSKNGLGSVFEHSFTKFTMKYL